MASSEPILIGTGIGPLNPISITLVSSGMAGSALSPADVGIYAFPAQVGIGNAGSANNSLRISTPVTSSIGSGAGYGTYTLGILTAGGNNHVLGALRVGPGFTPGAFTGVIARGIQLDAFSTAAFASPGDPSQIVIGQLDGTGSVNAVAIRISPPVNATNNYIIADNSFNTFTVLSSGQMGLGIAAQTQKALRIGGNITAQAGTATGIAIASTQVAIANGDTLYSLNIAPVQTPGAFTGLNAIGISVLPFSTAAFTAPADPISINVGAVTGTGAVNGYGVKVAAPLGATNNYAIYSGGVIGISSATAAFAPSGGGTDIILGGTTQTTVGAAGGASALPATPLGYLIAFRGATKIAIPYYNG